MKYSLSKEDSSKRDELFTKIRDLKKKTNTVILSHYYMPPELQLLENEGGVADYLGDSLGLSLEASKTPAANILFCGVNFMAETALILSPDKQVFMPDITAGCSLAESIKAADVVTLKKKHPGLPVMTYINTYAETKAESDICCTSRNALTIAGKLNSDRIIFIPDKFMGQNLAERIQQELGKELILWDGTCEVHEQFRSGDMKNWAEENKDAELLMHWEVPNESVKAGFSELNGIVGSTNDIVNYIQGSKAKTFILASECDLAATLSRKYSDREFITPCIRCPYMKQSTPEKVLEALEAIGTENQVKFQITLPADILRKALSPVQKMLEYTA